RLHDLRLVRSSEIRGQAAVDRGPDQLGHRLLRILAGRTRQPHRPSGLFGGRAEDHAGGDHPAGLRDLLGALSRREADGEPPDRLRPDRRRGLLHLQRAAVRDAQSSAAAIFSARVFSCSASAIGAWPWPFIGRSDQRGTMWKCRWNTVWPPASPLNCIRLRPSGFSAFSTARAVRCTAAVSLASASGSISRMLRAVEVLDTIRTWPSDWGNTSMKARTSSSSHTFTLGMSPRRILAKMLSGS